MSIFDELDTEAADARLQRRLSGADMVPLEIALADPADEDVAAWCRRLAAEPLDELRRQPAGDHLFRLFLAHDSARPGGVGRLGLLDDAELYRRMRPGPARAQFAREVLQFYFVDEAPGVSPPGPRVPDGSARPALPDGADEDPGDGALDAAEEDALRALRGSHYPAFLLSPQFVRYAQMRELCARRRLGAKDFSFFRFVGAGAYGDVAAVSTRDTRQVYACKTVSIASLKAEPGGTDLLRNEFRMLAAAGGTPFATRLRYAYRSGTDFCMVMDYCSGGDLRLALREGGGRGPRPLAPERALFYAAEMLAALSHLHARGLIYRDLKPANVLLHASGHIVLSDFAFAAVLARMPGGRATSRTGTPGYWAPECLAGVPYGAEADMWSWAVTVHHLFAGRGPPCACPGAPAWCTFARGAREREAHEQRARDGGLATFNAGGVRLHESLPPTVRDLLSLVLVPDGAARPTADEALGHAAFASFDVERLLAHEEEPPYVPGEFEIHADTIGRVEEARDSPRKRQSAPVTAEDLAAFDELTYANEALAQAEMADAMRVEFERFGPMPDAGFAAAEREADEEEDERRRRATGGSANDDAEEADGEEAGQTQNACCETM